MQPTAISNSSAMKQAVTLQNILDKAVDGRKIFGTVFCVQHQSHTWCGAAGNFSVEQPFFMASTTKLFVTALIMQLRSKGNLTLDDPIGQYLAHRIVEGLHIHRGIDHGPAITVRQLLDHSSGIPDYFEGKVHGGKTLLDQLIEGDDRAWSFEEAIALSKTMQPYFLPGEAKKAHYSDTNYQLLGRIIEQLTGKSFAEACRAFIIEPLGLKQTYLYQDPRDRRPLPMYHRRTPFPIYQAMSSFGPDGGMVSTAGELNRFLRAFFQGHLFPADYLKELSTWRRIFFPMQAGVGIHRFKPPWIFDPMGRLPELIGHSGLSGTFAFHSPADDLYVAGTVNQVAHRSASFQLAIKLIQTLKAS